MTQPLTDQQLDDIETRATSEHLTPGPWKVEWDYCDCSEYGCGHGKFAVAFGPFTWIESRDGVITTDAEFAAHAREDVPALLADLRRARAELAEVRELADRRRSLALLEVAEFVRSAHFGGGMSVQEIGTALAHMADDADPMVGSLARDGFGVDEIAAMLAKPASRPSGASLAAVPTPTAPTEHQTPTEPPTGLQDDSETNR